MIRNYGWFECLGWMLVLGALALSIGLVGCSTTAQRFDTNADSWCRDLGKRVKECR